MRTAQIGPDLRLTINKNSSIQILKKNSFRTNPLSEKVARPKLVHVVGQKESSND